MRPCGRAAVRPCGRAAVRPCGRAAVRPCMRAAVHACGRARARPCRMWLPRAPSRGDLLTTADSAVTAWWRWGVVVGGWPPHQAVLAYHQPSVCHLPVCTVHCLGLCAVSSGEYRGSIEAARHTACQLYFSADKCMLLWTHVSTADRRDGQMRRTMEINRRDRRPRRTDTTHH